jgi:CheY-like chemotaxis protein
VSGFSSLNPGIHVRIPPKSDVAQSILIVVDEKSQRQILETLSGEGYEVTTAAASEIARELAKERRFDTVIADLDLPAVLTAQEQFKKDGAPREVKNNQPADSVLYGRIDRRTRCDRIRSANLPTRQR